MATRVIDDNKLNNIATAIQAKDNGGQMTVDEMPARIAAIPSQDMTLINSLIDRSIISIESDVTSVGNAAFSGCRSLTTAIFPNATSVGNDAFIGCLQLKTAIFPNATSLGVSSMRGCEQLTTIEIPKTIQINAFCFFGCYWLPRIFLQSVTALTGQQIFWSCLRLTTVIMGKRATLNNANSFTNNNAIIYVQPDDLSWYETETNWSTLYANNRIKSVAELTGDDLTWYQQQLAKYPEEE